MITDPHTTAWRRSATGLIVAISVVTLVGCDSISGPDDRVVGAVTVSPSNASIMVGGTLRFTAALEDQHGSRFVGPEVSWSVDDAGVATVDADGRVTSKGDGLATITATAGSVSGSVQLTMTWPASGGYWEPMDFSHVGHVIALTTHDGDLIAGGAFGTGLYDRWIARWNGSKWRGMGAGMDGPVLALTSFDGDLIAGGFFTTAGGQTGNPVARWDGSAWHSVGAGMWDNTDGAVAVTSLASHDGDLIAGGRFTTAGGHVVNNIARWDGSEWRPLGPGLNGHVGAITEHDGDLIAGGEGFLSRWDGSDWHSMSSGYVHTVNAFVVHEGELYAGGLIDGAAVARWDGSTWRSVGSGTREYANAFAVHDRQLIAAGDFAFTFGSGTSYIAGWDGARWQSVGHGITSTISALAVYDGHLIAGGGFTVQNGSPADFIARWVTP